MEDDFDEALVALLADAELDLEFIMPVEGIPPPDAYLNKGAQTGE